MPLVACRERLGTGHATYNLPPTYLLVVALVEDAYQEEEAGLLVGVGLPVVAV